MRLATLVLGTAALALFVGGAGGGEAKKKSKLQGTWKFTSAIADGDKKPEIDDMTLTLAAKTFTVKTGVEVFMKGTYKADAKKKPHEIDFTFAEGPDEIKDKTGKAIYEIKGDTLRICIRRPGDDERPTEFTSTDGSRRHLITFKREKK
jgi:uncharacterized protein (TIGR03067 family)